MEALTVRRLALDVLAGLWSTGVTELRHAQLRRPQDMAYRAHAGLDMGNHSGYDADALRDARTPSVSFAFRYTYDRGRNLNGVSVFSRIAPKG